MTDTKIASGRKKVTFADGLKCPKTVENVLANTDGTSGDIAHLKQTHQKPPADFEQFEGKRADLNIVVVSEPRRKAKKQQVAEMDEEVEEEGEIVDGAEPEQTAAASAKQKDAVTPNPAASSETPNKEASSPTPKDNHPAPMLPGLRPSSQIPPPG
ncbi:hypothetical protein MMC26_001424 [Xylographa opegraphella]|nr:hypothetical protein [Xylographa opegraphella]